MPRPPRHGHGHDPLGMPAPPVQGGALDHGQGESQPPQGLRGAVVLLAHDEDEEHADPPRNRKIREPLQR